MGLDTTIQAILDGSDLDYEKQGAGKFFVVIPGIKKLRTNCLLTRGEHALKIEAFVCRNPDESHEKVYRFLLRRNEKLYGVHYTVDALGDIYLVGRLGLQAITAAELDKIFGQIVEAADGDFNTLLELGFASSIRREWQWRTSRGESVANLRAFVHLTQPEK